jgi:hypothetical protein
MHHRSRAEITPLRRPVFLGMGFVAFNTPEYVEIPMLVVSRSTRIFPPLPPNSI